MAPVVGRWSSVVGQRCYQIIAQNTVFPFWRCASGVDSGKARTVAKKKKTRRFRAVTAVKEMARERIGTPRPTQVVPDRKKRKHEKRKPTLEELLNSD